MTDILANPTKASMDAAINSAASGDVIKIAAGTLPEYQAPRNINFKLTFAPQNLSNPPHINGWNGAGRDPTSPGNFFYCNADTGVMNQVTWDGLIFYARRMTVIKRQGTNRTLDDDPDAGTPNAGYGWRVDQNFNPALSNELAENANYYGLRMGGNNNICQNCVFNGFGKVLTSGDTGGIVRHNLFEQSCEDMHKLGSCTDSLFEYNLYERFRGATTHDANKCWTWPATGKPPHSDSWQLSNKTIRLTVRRNVINDPSGRVHGILMQLSKFSNPNPSLSDYHVDPVFDNNYFALSHDTGIIAHHANRPKIRNNKIVKVGSVDTPTMIIGVGPDGFDPAEAPNATVTNNIAPDWAPEADDSRIPASYTWDDNFQSNTAFPDPWVEIRKNQGGAAATEWAGPYGKTTDPVPTPVPPGLTVPAQVAWDHNALAGASAPVGSWNSYIKIPSTSPAYDATEVSWAPTGSTTRNDAVKQSTDGPGGEHIYRLNSSTGIHWHTPGQTFSVGIYYKEADNDLVSDRSTTDLSITIASDPTGIIEVPYADFVTNYRVYANDGTALGVREIMEVYDWTGMAFQKPAPVYTGSSNTAGATISRPNTPNAIKIGSYVIDFLYHGTTVASTPPASGYLTELKRLEGSRGCSGNILGGFADQATTSPGAYTGSITGIRHITAAFDDVDPLDPVEDSALAYNTIGNLTVNVPALTLDAAADTNYRIVIGLSGDINNTYPAIPGFTLIRDSNSLPHIAMYYSTWPVTAFSGMAITTTGANTNSIGFAVALRLKKLGTGTLLAPILMGTLADWTFAAGPGINSYGTVASGFHGTDLVYSLSTGATGVSISPTTGILVADSSATSAGVKSLVVRATNASGFVDQPLTLTVTGITIPLVVGTIGPWNVASASGVQTFDASVGFSGASITYSLSTGSTGVSINSSTGVVSADTSVTTNGTKSLVVRATNSAGFASQPLSLVVSAIAAPTTVGTLSAWNINGGSGTQTYATAGGFAGTGLAYSLISAPTGYTINSSTGVVSANTATALSATLTVRATNAGGTANQSLVVSVLAVPGTVGSLGPWNETQNTGNKTIPTAGGFSGTSLTYSLVTPPTGVTINASTGVLTANTGTVGLGTKSLTVRATNAAGFASQTFNLVVTEQIWMSGAGTRTDVNISGTDYVIRTLTATGTIDILVAGTYDLLYCASGGAGGNGPSSTAPGGGGGGGFKIRTGVALTAGSYNVTIGDPGAGSTDQLRGPNGGNLVAFGDTVLGGGGGGGGGNDAAMPGGSGGSGGGGAVRSASFFGAGGAGTAGQGNNGGNTVGSATTADKVGGSGGGAGAAAGANSGTVAGAAGIGFTSNFDGTSTVYSPGGTGTTSTNGTPGAQAPGGGKGSSVAGGASTPGTAPGSGGGGDRLGISASGTKGVFKIRHIKP